jgi:hypothetical protein
MHGKEMEGGVSVELGRTEAVQRGGWRRSWGVGVVHKEETNSRKAQRGDM